MLPRIIASRRDACMQRMPLGYSPCTFCGGAAVVAIVAARARSDALRSRIYKEFRRQTMTVLETRRVKSMMHVAVPKTTENIKLSDSLQLQLQEDESVVITTAITILLWISLSIFCGVTIPTCDTYPGHPHHEIITAHTSRRPNQAWMTLEIAWDYHISFAKRWHIMSENRNLKT